MRGHGDAEGRPVKDLDRGGAYLLTWTTYGSWLPGDGRGFVSHIPVGRGKHTIRNIPGEPIDFDDRALLEASDRQRRGATVVLTPEQAAACGAALRETATRHGLRLHAAAVMATHVHVVVSSPAAEGAKVLNLFKGVSSRRLGAAFGKPMGGAWWTKHGSRRLLLDGRALEASVTYVLNQPTALIVVDDSIAQEPPSRRLQPMDRIIQSHRL